MTQASGYREVSWAFKRRWGEKKKIDFKCKEGTGEDQKGRAGFRVRAVPAGERWTEVISAGSQRARRRLPTEREVAEGKTEENENNSFSLPTTEAPKSGIFVFLLGHWFVFIFWENQTLADQGSLLALLAFIEPNLWSASCVRHRDSGSCFYYLSAP